MKLALAAATALLATMPVAANAASFDTTPPATNPSGTSSFPFTIRSTSSTVDNTWVAYKLPTGGWVRCQHPNPVSFDAGALPDGTYTVQIADDINVDYWASIGQGNSGQTAPCSTASQPATAVSSYTFKVGATDPPPVVVPDPTPPSPAPVVVPVPVFVPVVTAPPTVKAPVVPDCKLLRTRYVHAKSLEARARVAYRHHHTATRRTAYLKAQRATRTARRRYLTPC